MPVKIRLHRVGAKHQPSYRIVVTPALTPRDGSYLDQVGFYNPVTEPTTLRIDNEKTIAWLRKGAQPTDRVARLLKAVDIIPSEVRKPAKAATAVASAGVETTAVEEATAPLPTDVAEELPAEKPKRTRKKTADEPPVE